VRASLNVHGLQDHFARLVFEKVRGYAARQRRNDRRYAVVDPTAASKAQPKAKTQDEEMDDEEVPTSPKVKPEINSGHVCESTNHKDGEFGECGLTRGMKDGSVKTSAHAAKDGDHDDVRDSSICRGATI
jgi:hypothetical protein